MKKSGGGGVIPQVDIFSTEDDIKRLKLYLKLIFQQQ